MPPTRAEIAAQLGFRSPNAAEEHLRALARKPTDRELKKCKDHIARAGNRAEAFEDILWALINSTEFQTKR